MSMRRQVLSFLFFSTMSGQLLAAIGPVSADEHVPQNSDAVILGDSLGFTLMIVPSPQCQTFCRSFSAYVQLPCCGSR